MGDREAVGRLKIVDIVVEVERFLGCVLISVVELDSKPERAVLLHRGSHEQSPLEEIQTKIRQLLQPYAQFIISISRFFC